MSRRDVGDPRADPAAPPVLIQQTFAVRNALIGSPYGDVLACCHEAVSVLALVLKARGYAAEPVACTYWGWPHTYCRVNGWGLDPTREQFPPDDLLVFELGSQGSYVPDQSDLPRPPPCEGNLICWLAAWIRDDRLEPPDSPLAGIASAVEPLLTAGGLEHLLPAVKAAECGPEPRAGARCFCGQPMEVVWEAMDIPVALCSSHAAPLLRFQERKHETALTPR